MAIANVVDGVITNQVNPTTAEKTSGTGGALDKDAFLQLLVAEMENQDPLEAQDNTTEYISQLATFSELESMQNLQTTAERLNYESMLGKTVVIKEDDESLVTGQVDNVMVEGNKTLFEISGEYYDAEKLYKVVDSGYLSAYGKASSIVKTMSSLPENPELATKEQLLQFGEIAKTYYTMNDYEKSYLTGEMQGILDAYVKKYEAFTGESLDPQKALNDRVKKESENLQDLLNKMIAAQASTSSTVANTGNATTDAIRKLQEALTQLGDEVAAGQSAVASSIEKAAESQNSSDEEVSEEALNAILTDQGETE